MPAGARGRGLGGGVGAANAHAAFDAGAVQLVRDPGHGSRRLLPLRGASQRASGPLMAAPTAFPDDLYLQAADHANCLCRYSECLINRPPPFVGCNSGLGHFKKKH